MFKTLLIVQIQLQNYELLLIWFNLDTNDQVLIPTYGTKLKELISSGADPTKGILNIIKDSIKEQVQTSLSNPAKE
jgi:hypothetical protein